MRRDDMLHGFIIIIIILFIAVNINGINSFLSFQTDNAAEFGHSAVVVPQAWNTTDEVNLTITNGYIFIKHWDDWPEDHITSISQEKFKSMEDGEYKVLKNSNTTLNGIPVSKQYFSNPSRNNDEVWDHIGVNYVFPKEDTNYAIQVHYFTTQDYNNSTFLKEVDNSIEDDINNIHNTEYNGFVSGVWHIYDSIVENIPD